MVEYTGSGMSFGESMEIPNASLSVRIEITPSFSAAPHVQTVPGLT